jgi:hypothetical protein
MKRVVLAFIALSMLIYSSAYAQAEGPRNSLYGSQSTNTDAFQGNDYYSIETFQTKA